MYGKDIVFFYVSAISVFAVSFFLSLCETFFVLFLLYKEMIHSYFSGSVRIEDRWPLVMHSGEGLATESKYLKVAWSRESFPLL